MRTVACWMLPALAVLLVACGDQARQVVDAQDDATADAPTDAPIDAPGGSATAWMGFEPSPKDHDLELAVLGLSVVVAGGPVGFRHRRRRAREL